MTGLWPVDAIQSIAEDRSLDSGWAFRPAWAPLLGPDRGIQPVTAEQPDGPLEADGAQAALRSTHEGAFQAAGDGTDGDLTGPFVSLSPGFMDGPP